MSAPSEFSFRPFTSTDKESCLAIFDANCPEFFAGYERDEYVDFLDEYTEGYEVCEADDELLGAFGLYVDDDGDHRLTWIMLSPNQQGRGIGSAMMKRVFARCSESAAAVLKLATSDKAAPFFEKFGATTTSYTEDGWAPGLHRVDMVVEVSPD